MKIIAWNVNGLRSVVKKKVLQSFLKKTDPDILCICETKLSHPDNESIESFESIGKFPYRYYSTSIAKKGYSGTAIWSKKKPIEILYGIGKKDLDREGRTITLEFRSYYLVHTYTPNSGEELKRLSYRVEKWDKEFQKFVKKLQKKKKVILCGDLNCAHHEIDIHSPKTNLKSAGFTLEERQSFDKYINKMNLIDSFRYKYPDKKDAYTYWSYKLKAREKK